MADNNELNFGVGADVSQAAAELQKLKVQINSTTANLSQTQNTIASSIKRMTSDIEKSIASAKAGSDQLLAAMRRLDRVQGNTLSSQARGPLAGQVRGAAGSLLINESRNSAEAVTARVTDALVQEFTKKLRTMDRVVDARMRQAIAQADRTVASASPELMQARQINSAQSDRDAIRRSQMGNAAFGMSNTLDRIGSNGGADIITVQAKLLAGYAALNLAMNGIRNTAQFVVDLDAEFRQFQAITNTTNSEMIGLKDSLIGVSEASKFTALDIAQAATVMGQAGLSAREVGETIGSVAELATAAGSSLAESVDVVTSTMAIFNLQTTQAADVANTLTAALNLSKLSMDKLVLGFQYAGNIAAQMGVTYQELTGVLGALANSGIRSGSTLGTGLRQLLIDIQDPSKKLTATLKELGLTQEDINVESNGLINVLETLKNSGFGAAQAFESLEVRAAAAYVALANNTELAVELQQQFILSAAAAEANAIQMESLSNTYAKFQSVVGTVAYNAFEPLVAALQDAINALANLIAGFNRVPGALQVTAVAFASLATAVGLLSLSALTRGLVGLLIPLSQVGAAATGAAGGVALLNTVMKLNPIVLGLSILAGAATAFYALGGGADSAADRIDALKAQVNIFNGQVSEADTQVGAITQTISNLIRQKAALDADPLMRTAKILEVKQAFKEISLEVDTTTGSVEDLIDALNRLAKGDFASIGASIRETMAANDALIAEYKVQLASTQASGVQGDLFNIGANELAYRPDAGVTFALDTAKQQQMIAEMMAEMFGEQFGRYASMIFNPSEMPTDMSSSNVIGSDINREISKQTEIQSILTARQRDGKPLTAEEIEQLNNLPLYMELLTALKAQMAPLLAANINIASAESQKKILEAQALQNSAEFKLLDSGVTGRIQDLESEYTDKFRLVRANTENLSAEELMQAYKDLDETFSIKIEALTTEAEKIVDSLISENPGTSPEQAKGAVSAATIPLTGLAARISTKSQNANVAFQAVQEEVFKIQLEEVDDAIQLQLNSRTRALTEGTLDEIRDYIITQFDKKAEITREIFGAKIAQEDDEDKISQLQAELASAQREINAEEKEALLKIADDRADLQVDMLDQQKAAIDEDIKLMEGRLNTLIQQIAKASPGPAMDALIAKWQQVAMVQQSLINDANTTEIQSNMLSTTGKAISGDAAGRANQAMQILVGLGYSQAQAAGVVGNLMAESGMNSTARGDGGMAFGLGQWHPDRQAKLEEFAATRGTDRNNFETQVRFIDWEMKNSKSTAGAGTYDALMNQTTASGAADIFRRLYERPSLDPKLGNHEGRVQYANGLMTNGYGAQSANTTEQITTLATSVQDGTNNSIKTGSAAAVTAAMQQVQTLMTQAGISSNPNTIKGMIDSVDQIYNGIIEEKLKAFDAENDQKIADGDAGTMAERDNLIEGLKADQNQKMSTLLETYWKALDEKIQEPLEDAKMALEEAQKPENAGKFTNADIMGLESNVRLAERKVLVDQLNAAQQVLAESQARLAETTPGTAENNYWLTEEARALDIVTELTRAKNAADMVTSQQSPSVTSAIQSATQAWAMQNGVLDELGNQIPLAKQVENAWGGVLDTLTSGFSTLFVDLAKGTMTAEEAFKKFALSVIDSFMQMIAKALAMQVVMALMGDGGEGGGMGDWLGTLLGVVAPAANGDYIRGAASGEVIPGTSNRDSVLRKVMPGEMILRRSAVSAIGAGALENINNLGSRTMSEGISPEMPANDNPMSPGSVNVWVVSPDQVPQMGPNDVIATVADNIQRRGSIKQLIKQVSLGSL